MHEKYSGDVETRFGPTLAAEHLLSEDGLTIDHETLRRWRSAASTEDFHRAVPTRRALDRVFQLKEPRTLSNDWVERYPIGGSSSSGRVHARPPAAPSSSPRMRRARSPFGIAIAWRDGTKSLRQDHPLPLPRSSIRDRRERRACSRAIDRDHIIHGNRMPVRSSRMWRDRREPNGENWPWTLPTV